MCLLLWLLLFLFHQLCSGDRTVLCYLGDGGAVVDSRFDPIGQKCTHIVYKFKYIEPEKLAVKSVQKWNGALKYPTLADYIKHLKSVNPELRLMFELTVESWDVLTQLYSSRQKWKNVAYTCRNSVRMESLEGIVLDPGAFLRDSSQQAISNFRMFLEDLNAELKKERFIIICRLNFNDLVRLSFVADVADYVEMVWREEVGLNHALASSPPPVNTESIINTLTARGIHPGKIILRLMTEGVKYDMLSNTTECCRRDYAIRNMAWSPFREACRQFSRDGWRHFWSGISKLSHAVWGNLIFTYVNQQSFYEKLNLVEWRGLNGVSFEPKDDDFEGVCYGRPFPLLNAIGEYFSQSNPSPAFRFDDQVVFEEFPVL